jgi:hypothetical protein
MARLTKENLSSFFQGVRAGIDAASKNSGKDLIDDLQAHNGTSKKEKHGSNAIVEGPEQFIYFPSDVPKVGDTVTLFGDIVPSNGFYTLNGPLFGSIYVIDGKIAAVELATSTNQDSTKGKGGVTLGKVQKTQPRTVKQLNMERVAKGLITPDGRAQGISFRVPLSEQPSNIKTTFSDLDRYRFAQAMARLQCSVDELASGEPITYEGEMSLGKEVFSILSDGLQPLANGSYSTKGGRSFVIGNDLKLEAVYASHNTPKEVKANVKAHAERMASDKATKELNKKLGDIKRHLGIR